MIYLKVNTKSYRILDYKKNILNKIKNKRGQRYFLRMVALVLYAVYFFTENLNTQ